MGGMRRTPLHKQNSDMRRAMRLYENNAIWHEIGCYAPGMRLAKNNGFHCAHGMRRVLRRYENNGFW